MYIKKIAIFQAYLDDHSGQEQDLFCLTLTTHQGHHMGSDYGQLQGGGLETPWQGLD